MVSQLKVNEIIKQSGSSITIGESGDTINIGTTGDTVNLAGSAYAAVSNTPAFAASNDSTIDSYSDNTLTKAALDKEVIDVGGCFNNTGSTVTLNGISTPSYSFAPNEAGTYLFTGAAGLESHNGSLENAFIEIRKNGTAIQRIYHNTGGGTIYDVSNAFAVVATADGVDDYFEMYVKINWNGSSTGKLLDEQNTQFIGYKLLGA
jgi:hypothetical protein